MSRIAQELDEEIYGLVYEALRPSFQTNTSNACAAIDVIRELNESNYIIVKH